MSMKQSWQEKCQIKLAENKLTYSVHLSIEKKGITYNLIKLRCVS